MLHGITQTLLSSTSIIIIVIIINILFYIDLEITCKSCKANQRQPNKIKSIKNFNAFVNLFNKT